MASLRAETALELSLTKDDLTEERRKGKVYAAHAAALESFASNLMALAREAGISEEKLARAARV